MFFRTSIGKSTTASIGSMMLSILVATPVHAFGLRTHLWIADRIVEDLRGTCRIDVGTVPIILEDAVCNSIRRHPKEFRAGVLGPDAYPDLITGQVTTHPGIKDDWQTSDWLRHLYAHAKEGPELAFAAGYVVHAASDVFAHSYVNAYAGDIFDLSDERAVERRHVTLEKFIDARLPNFAFDRNEIEPPLDFVRDKLIFNPDAARLASKATYAGHIWAMQSTRTSVYNLSRELDKLEDDAGRVLGDVIASIAKANVDMATLKYELDGAINGLKGHEEALKHQQKAFDAANKAFQEAIDAVDRNRGLLNHYQQQADVARAGRKAAEDTIARAMSELNNLVSSIQDLRNRLVGIPATISENVCRWLPPPADRFCRELQRVNPLYGQLTAQVQDEVAKVAQARAAIEANQALIPLRVAEESKALQAKAAEAALTTELEAARATAQAARDLHMRRLQAELDATNAARGGVEHLQNELEKLRAQVVDQKAIRDAIQSLIAHSDILSGYSKNWERGLDVAGREFIRTSHRVILGTIDHQSSFVREYMNWYKCYGSAFTPVPYQLGEAVCTVEAFYDHLSKETETFVVKVLPPPFSDLAKRYLSIREHIQNQLNAELNNAALSFVKLIAPDPTTGDFIELLARPENATAGKLDEVFAAVGDAAGKNLLVFSGMSGLIEKDLGVRNGALDPRAFNALRHALTLSKLALLDGRGVKRLTWVLGGNADEITVPPGLGRYSILYSMVRSIDGNHQWQPYGLPYARSAGHPVPVNGSERHYGHGGKGSNSPGFELFQKPALRKAVFERIFGRDVAHSNGIAGQLMEHPQMSSYPFRECAAHPFPLAFNSAGEPAPEDLGCIESAEQPSRTGGWLELFRRAANRIGLGPR